MPLVGHFVGNLHCSFSNKLKTNVPIDGKLLPIDKYFSIPKENKQMEVLSTSTFSICQPGEDTALLEMLKVTTFSNTNFLVKEE